ncbi:hypothetical protein LENED_005998 [Lentinula edodes]|uniref:Uncharacterized protein n=1 Tax=Lentinula edodes TaxID=5353 RepID=A0A1Q3EAQ1_LENED|nr:hypothetical protein LENED_005998 [Lentinula edodes]
MKSLEFDKLEECGSVTTCRSFLSLPHIVRWTWHALSALRQESDQSDLSSLSSSRMISRLPVYSNRSTNF